ncbi:MAG: YdcF family protein [Lachnospiraceae bacterium]|nr:YdcF family protein [Lachnospiraceae bacterium]
MKRLISAFVMLNAAVFFIVFPNPRKKVKKENYDCAIVCGYFANSDGTPSEFMKSRVDKAVELWKKEKVKYLLLSGGAVRNEHTEAYVMKKYAMELGVPEDVILVEKEAVSTYHNMLYAKEIMAGKNLENCVVVTNSWHLRKANHYAKKFELDYVMAEAREPEGEKKFMTIWRHISLNLHMYYMMFKGYY